MATQGGAGDPSVTGSLAPHAAPAPSRDPSRPACITSQRLFGGRRVLVIQHGGDEYRLCVTRAGKLILTK